MKVLQAYLQRLSISRGPHSTAAIDHADLLEHERLAYAMIVSLFAVSILDTGLLFVRSYGLSQATESRKAENMNSVASPPFRPHTLATLLTLIQFVMHSRHDSTTLDFAYPVEELDIAQTILVRWGETVPYCWTMWDDQRIAHMESISHLV